MLIKRPFWEQIIEKNWQEKSIIWLMGVRRVGKTSLCKSLENITYFDCESPRLRQLLTTDPEAFLEQQHGKRIVLDEIHRLDNPSEVLKLAADHYPEVKIIATGSSTLGASAKFKDTLTGRKRELWLTPLLLEELETFGSKNLDHRFLFGGFPSFFSQKELPEQDFREWLDAYWAKDIQELFRVEKRYSFIKFVELLLSYSGGQFEASSFTAPCEVSRQTISNYLTLLEETFVVHVVRPYSSHRATEIVSAPKVYGFDTGFVCYAKGWRELRKEDNGLLWEHCVLNELHGHLQRHIINYWRNKQGNEIDFIIPSRGNRSVTAIECKFSCAQEDLGKSMLDGIGKNIASFRKRYPHGENFIVASNVIMPFEREYEGIKLIFVNPQELVKRLQKNL